VLWSHDTAIACAGAHEGSTVSVTSTSTDSGKPAIVTAGSEGTVSVWTPDLKRIKRFTPRLSGSSNRDEEVRLIGYELSLKTCLDNCLLEYQHMLTAGISTAVTACP
jgi:WD40 repeat protein